MADPAAPETAPPATPRASITVAWSGGGAARVTAITGDAVTVVSDKPFAPGARPSGSLGPALGSRELRMKVHRCRKIDDAFTIDGRLIDATRSLMDDLQRALSPP